MTAGADLQSTHTPPGPAPTLAAEVRRLANRPGFCWLEQDGRQLLAADPVATWQAPPHTPPGQWLGPALAARAACGGLLLGLLPYPDRPNTDQTAPADRQGLTGPAVPARVHLYTHWLEADAAGALRECRAAGAVPAGLPPPVAAPPAPPRPFRLLAPFAAAMAFEDPAAATDYRRAFAHLQAWLLAGDIYQANLAMRFDAPCAGDPFTAHLALRTSHRAPWAGYFALGGEDAVLCHSPEAFLETAPDGTVTTRPIKGTRRRGDTPAADLALAAELARSTKDRAENLMIVDLLRNDLGRVCDTGSVAVRELFRVETHTHVHHLVSTVSGRLRAGAGIADLLDAAFPGGSITGAPKKRAREVITALENRPREVYCGSLFSVDAAGRLASNITIRTLLARGGELACWGGGGIVADSDCHAEFAECLSKAGPLLRACESFITNNQ
jgi:para-aminobenzoate synthetase component 1